MDVIVFYYHDGDAVQDYYRVVSTHYEVLFQLGFEPKMFSCIRDAWYDICNIRNYSNCETVEIRATLSFYGTGIAETVDHFIDNAKAPTNEEIVEYLIKKKWHHRVIAFC